MPLQPPTSPTITCFRTSSMQSSPMPLQPPTSPPITPAAADRPTNSRRWGRTLFNLGSCPSHSPPFPFSSAITTRPSPTTQACWAFAWLRILRSPRASVGSSWRRRARTSQRGAPASCWPGRRATPSLPQLVGRPAAGSFCFCTPMILPGITPRFFGEESSFLRNPAAKTTERWRFSVISMATNGICSNSARRLPGVARDLDRRLIRLITSSLWPPSKPDVSVFLPFASPPSTSV